MSGDATYTHLQSRLHLALGLNAVVIAAEFTGGVVLNSVGLIGDAGHNLIDQGALFAALYAHILTARPATEARTFGYHRRGQSTYPTSQAAARKQETPEAPHESPTISAGLRQYGQYRLASFANVGRDAQWRFNGRPLAPQARPGAELYRR